MNNWKSAAKEAIRFRRFERRNYSAFRSMHKVINMGVVSASTLLFAFPVIRVAVFACVFIDLNMDDSCGTVVILNGQRFGFAALDGILIR